MTSELHNTSATASLYTELPYPGDGVVRTTNARILRGALRKHYANLLARRRLRIVDVGCGTGENTLGLARIFPAAEVLGIDINERSLELANQLAKREGSLVRFVRGDITADLAKTLHEASPGAFDIVFSMGVLHHLAVPSVGFSAVRELVASDGLLFCFVYSRPGRREDLATKELLTAILPANSSFQMRSQAISALRLSNRHTMWQAVKAIRRRWKFGPPMLPLELLRVAFNRNRIIHESDSYSNPCEHLYTCREIRTLLAETGWEFDALAENAGLPSSPEQHTRKKAELDLLRRLSPDSLYDYFAFYYQAQGLSFFAKPADDGRDTQIGQGT
jgi:SAM-dependent methyltransferase